MLRQLAQRIVPYANAALSFIYPDVCQLCARERATRREGYVCRVCRERVHVIQPPFCDRCGLPFEGEMSAHFECANCREMELHFASARSAVAARGPVLEAVHRYKYKGELWFEGFFGDYLIPAAKEWAARRPSDSIVPVPLFPVKERERGFNQAERLARLLGKAINLPVNSRLLRRVVPTPSQTRLSRTQRADNMKGAFALRGETVLTGQCILLIDDVFTTGATTSACARVLLKAGASRVEVWTLARAEFHGFY